MKTQIVQRLADAAKKYKYLLIVVAAGILLLLLPTGSKDSPSAGEDAEPDYESFALADTERRISEVLEQMQGVGKTEVVLTLAGTMETVYQTDTRTDTRDGSKSYESETVTTSAGSGVQSAVVSTRRYPQFRGALVVCEGGGSASVRLEVTRAVAALTGLSSDRITVARLEVQ